MDKVVTSSTFREEVTNTQLPGTLSSGFAPSKSQFFLSLLLLLIIVTISYCNQMQFHLLCIKWSLTYQHHAGPQDGDSSDEEDEIFCRQATVPTNQVLQSLSLSFKTSSPSSGSHTTWRTWWSSTARATPIWSFGSRCSSADNYHGGQWACFLHWYITT